MKLNHVMNKIFSVFISVAALLLFTLQVQAQHPRTVEADKAFNSGDYYSAIDLYKQAYTKEKNKSVRAEIVFKTAESYRMVNDAKNQEVWYDKAIQAGYKDNVALLRIADAMKFQGKYDEAIAKYNQYLAVEPGDEKGTMGIKSSEEAQKWKDSPTRHRIENVSPL